MAQQQDFPESEVTLEFLNRANLYAERLASVQEDDASIIRLGLQLREAKAQFLASIGEIEQAIDMQTSLVQVQKRQAESKPEVGQFETWAFSNIILGFMLHDVERISESCEALKLAEETLRPFAEKGTLSGYMMNAATRLDATIQRCEEGEPLGSQNALFDN